MFSYRTTLCIEQHPSVVALGVLFLTALQLGIRPVNTNPRSTVEYTWYALLEADIEFDLLQSKSILSRPFQEIHNVREKMT